MNRRKIARISAIALGLFSAAFLALALVTLIKSYSTKNWDVVEGVLESSKITSYHHIRSGEQYSIKVTYSYSHKGKNHKGDRVSLGGLPEGKRITKELLQELREQNPLLVYVNPSNSEEAVLLNKVNRADYANIVIHVLVIVFCGFGYWRLR